LSEPRRGKDRLGRDVTLGGTRAANHVMQSFRTIWNHAAHRMMDGDLKECPTSALELHSEETETQVIEPLSEWAEQVARLDPIPRAAYRLLLTTGMRKTEALSLRWEQVHADRIHLPMTKNGRAFDVPLEPEHRAILNLCRLGDGSPYHPTWVFPTSRGEGYLKVPPAIKVGGRVATLQMHRATFATWGEKAGLAPWQVGRLLNHTLPGVTASNYIRSEIEHYRPFMRNVLDALPV
jgi:integrase